LKIKITRIPLTENLYFHKHTFNFYKTLFYIHPNRGYVRYLISIILLNIKLFLFNKITIHFDDFKLDKDDEIILLKRNNIDRTVFLISNNKSFFVYKLFIKDKKSFKNEINTLNNIKISKNSRIDLPKVIISTESQKYDLIKLKINNFKIMKPKKEFNSFLKDYKIFYDSYLKDKNLIHGDLAFWNISKTNFGYEVFDWETVDVGTLDMDIAWFYLTSVKVKHFELNSFNNNNLSYLDNKISLLGNGLNDMKIKFKFKKLIKKLKNSGIHK